MVICGVAHAHRRRRECWSRYRSGRERAVLPTLRAGDKGYMRSQGALASDKVYTWSWDI